MTSEHHWPEYAIEALSLGLFMLSATIFATLLQHPASPISTWRVSPLTRRGVMGVAMGVTAMAIIYSPLGRRSGAHMNPALTLTYLRLGKLSARDAIGYVIGQFAGGLGGILVADRVLRNLPAHPAVNFIATVPGSGGAALAFVAEGAISFGMMLLVLTATNSARLSRFTGLLAGALVAIYISFEAPISGMSMNPARTFGPALLAHTGASLWIYFVAPPLGMLAAAELFVRHRSLAHVRCAKLYHSSNRRCIFRCGFMENRA